MAESYRFARARGRRWVGLALAAVLVALLHGAALESLGGGPRSMAAPAMVLPVVELVPARVVPAARVAAAEPATTEREPEPEQPAAIVAPAPESRPAARPVRRAPVQRPVPAQMWVPVANPDAPPAPGASAPGAAAEPTPPAEQTLPVYPTRMPPAFSFRYELRRGALSGQGDISLSFGEQGYEARLSGRVAGISVLDWSSTGRIDAAGLAPLRFVEKRIGRSAQAANFQREGEGAPRITYSGNADVRALPPGAQDRLSWMLQLAAIAQARPARLAPGERIAMLVTGVRGDTDVWSFAYVGPEPVETPLGTLNTVHLLREPRVPYDTRADIWIDPARHYLPVKARQSSAPDGSDAFELLLQQAGAATP